MVQRILILLALLFAATPAWATCSMSTPQDCPVGPAMNSPAIAGNITPANVSIVTTESQMTAALLLGGTLYIAADFSISSTKTISVAGTSITGPGTITAAVGFTGTNMIQISASNATLNIALDGNSSVLQPSSGLSCVYVSGGDYSNIHTGTSFSCSNAFGAGVTFDNTGGHVFSGVYMDHPRISNVGWAGIQMESVTGSIISPSIISTGWDALRFTGGNKVQIYAPYVDKSTPPTAIYNGSGSFGGLESGAFLSYAPTDVVQVTDPVFSNNINSYESDCIQFLDDGTAQTGSIHITNPNITQCSAAVDLGSNSSLVGGHIVNPTWAGIYLTYDNPPGGTVQNTTVQGTTIVNVRQNASSVALTTPGTGFAVNDIVQFPDGLFVTVTAETGGIPSAISLTQGGSFDFVGAGSVLSQTHTTGSGTGMQVTPTTPSPGGGRCVLFATRNSPDSSAPVSYLNDTVNVNCTDTRSPQAAPYCYAVNTWSTTFANVYAVGSNCSNLSPYTVYTGTSLPSGLYLVSVGLNGATATIGALPQLGVSSGYGNNQIFYDGGGDIEGAYGTDSSGSVNFGSVTSHYVSLLADGTKVMHGCPGGGVTFDNATGTIPAGGCTAGTANMWQMPQIGGVKIILSATSPSVGGSPVAGGACISTTVSLANSTNAQGTIATPQTYPGDGFLWYAYESAADTVTVKECNFTSGSLTPTASVFNVRAIQ